MLDLLAPAEVSDTSFEARHNGRKRWCLLRFKRHSWTRTEDARHAWKVCNECGRKRMTHHINCHPACFSGPA